MPEEQLITVRGGEDYQFGSFSLKVIPSIHSPLDHKRYFSSATAPAGMKAPLTLEQIHPEGGTLAYLIRFYGHQILAFGGMNYIEREIVRLEPDVALVGAVERSIRINNCLFGETRFWQGFPGENRLKSHRAARIRRKR